MALMHVFGLVLPASIVEDVRLGTLQLTFMLCSHVPTPN